eukprot:Plantae.Rhodophyta-Palmaria_palmata.ctg6985.p1 GENE.Plantae.Rhodophyta-Palmaria_palmata.ctg6985~~Plantae.Rhodophyta-Palmaria_palmata.ctg6985.p1  ORF type:complete len:240 (+),score=40.48 Plantae.Rhodophyta-Palmaria_palmata.ctg6985:276-995(+)
MAAGIQSVLEVVSFTLKALEKHELTVCQQRKELLNLMNSLCEHVGLLNVADDDTFEDLSALSYFIRDSAGGGLWVCYSSVELLVKDCGSWATEELAKLSSGDKRKVLKVVAVYCVDLVLGLREVNAERDSENEAADEDHPPVFPAEYAAMRTNEFISKVLDPFRSHLSKHWKAHEIDEIEKDHKALVMAVRTDSLLRDKFECHSRKTMFNDAWDDCGGRFSELRLFAGVLQPHFRTLHP